MNANSDLVTDWRRSGAVRAIAQLRSMNIAEAARRTFPDDPQVALRAATVPATTTDTSWAAQLAQTTTDARAFLQALQPRSAAAALFDRALEVDLSGRAAARLPKPGSTWPAPAWVAEGSPIPVREGLLAADTLGPLCKLMALVVLTDELGDLTGGGAEAIIGDCMIDAAGRELDAALFSTDAASTIQPAGLFHGVAPLGAAGLDAGRYEAALADLTALVAGIAAGGGGGGVLFFAAPAQAFAIRAMFSNVDVVPAPSFAGGTVAAVDVGAFAWSGRLPPEIETARSAVLHMEGDEPGQIGTPGEAPDPSAVSAPALSTFQHAMHAMRLWLPVTWVVRSSAAVQVVNGTAW